MVVISQCQTPGSKLVSWLHENYLDFIPSGLCGRQFTPGLVFASDRISWADAHLTGGAAWRLGLSPASPVFGQTSGTACPIRANQSLKTEILGDPSQIETLQDRWSLGSDKNKDAVEYYLASVVTRSLLLAPGMLNFSAQQVRIANLYFL
ncbi:unnamed protein product [Protopolystoma xenopodis]|uniref:Uncharacterized protein n=1 Tax=Protopolystoma xenopodis TaxID=117903 RepID=A0A448XAL6_9PLAT|nr:unnamed protein product [Protopolystoma xenopodis]